ncbi:hypothetical protein PG994_009103 [Apiospora phragmitis]|uniref:Uncharacterized protein n=1 Tax=Apiospora phragmitis TaxID=2905665 RepID=A0ABR1UKQ5_9PEZI
MLDFALNRDRNRPKPTRQHCGGDDDVMGRKVADVGGATQVPWGKALGNSVVEIELGGAYRVELEG